MAVDFKSAYGSLAGGPSPEYPFGFGINESVLGAGDGSPFEQVWFRDYQGLFQKLLDEAGITPSGVPDTVLASDYFDALGTIFVKVVQIGEADAQITTNARVKTLIGGGEYARKVTSIAGGATGVIGAPSAGYRFIDSSSNDNYTITAVAADGSSISVQNAGGLSISVTTVWFKPL